MLKTVKGSAFANIASASRGNSKAKAIEKVSGAVGANAPEEQATRNEADVRKKTERTHAEIIDIRSKKSAEQVEQGKVAVAKEALKTERTETNNQNKDRQKLDVYI